MLLCVGSLHGCVVHHMCMYAMLLYHGACVGVSNGVVYTHVWQCVVICCVVCCVCVLMVVLCVVML